MMAKSQSKATLRANLRRISPALIVFLVGFGLIFGSAGRLQAAAVQAANAGREGQTIDLNTLPAKGKTTVVDVFSPYCPPCMQLAPLLEQLAQKRPDLVIKKVNIQRPEISGKID
jgi:thiol-disulfide isomerase/thioredoxin